MSDLPGWMLQHSISIEALTGEGAYGPVYAASVTARCFLDEKTRLVRGPSGDEVTSTSTAYCRLSTTVPAGSRVTLPDGRQTTAIATLRRSGGAMVTPDHLEVQLL